MSNNFSPEDLARFEEAFAYFDRDNDGYLPSEELGTIMRALGQTPSEIDVQNLLAEHRGKPGLINFEEFLVFMANNMQNNETEEEIKEAFRVFDKEGTGMIPVQELKHVLTTLGEKLTLEEAEEMLAEVDTENTGFINYAEFVDMLLAK